MLDNLLRTGCPAVDPNFYLGHGFRPGKRRRCPAVAGIPAPADEIVVRDVVKKVCEGSSAILLRIFDLLAKLACRASNKYHLVLGGGQSPLRTAGRHMRARKIRCLMACITTHPVHSAAVLAPYYVLKMHMTVVSLKRRITRGMTILAARRGQDTIKLQESGARGICVRLGRRSCHRGCEQGRNCAEPQDCQHAS